LDRDGLFLPDLSCPDLGSVGDWLKQQVYSMLIARRTKGLQTFVYVKDLNMLEAQYGETFAEWFAEPHFMHIDS
jgi:hypothetical protein